MIGRIASAGANSQLAARQPVARSAPKQVARARRRRAKASKRATNRVTPLLHVLRVQRNTLVAAPRALHNKCWLGAPTCARVNDPSQRARGARARSKSLEQVSAAERASRGAGPLSFYACGRVVGARPACGQEIGQRRRRRNGENKRGRSDEEVARLCWLAGWLSAWTPGRGRRRLSARWRHLAAAAP